MATHPNDRQHHVVLERIPITQTHGTRSSASHEDAEVYHTAAWLEFLAATQGAEPVIAAVSIDGRPVGYFVGAIVRRLGARVLGSPLRGWGTQCMGFLLDEESTGARWRTRSFRSRSTTFDASTSSWPTGSCRAETCRARSTPWRSGSTYSIDLMKSEDALLHAMQPKTRQKIRKAVRGQLRVEETTDLAFADEFHAFLTEPSSGRESARPMTWSSPPIDRVAPGTGTLLLLRVRSPEGNVLAAGISVGGRRVAVSWGSRWIEPRRPNPAHLRGGRPSGIGANAKSRCSTWVAPEYKEKYGPVDTVTAHFLRSRWPIVRVARMACAGSHIRAKSSRALEAAVAPARRLVRNERCDQLTRNVDLHSFELDGVVHRNPGS